MLLRGSSNQDSSSSYLQNSAPAKSLSGNQWCHQFSPTTFLEEEKEDSALGRSAVTPLGATYNQNYSNADSRDRYTKELEKTTTTTEAIKSIANDHNLGQHLNRQSDICNHVFEERKMCSFDVPQSIEQQQQQQQQQQQSIVQQQQQEQNYRNETMLDEDTARPPVISSSTYSCTKQWSSDKIARTSTMDEELSFMMERYLESSGTRIHDSVPVFGTVQPSPGQQSTDSGFASDTPHHSLMSYPEQLIPEPVNTGFQTGYDPSFYSGYGQYYGCNEPALVTSHLPNSQYFEQPHDTTSAANQPPWESDNYNNDDLSQIVDQVLSSIDAQFCDITSASSNSTWTQSDQPVSISRQDEVSSSRHEEANASKSVNGKIELCDNCGNLVTEPEESCRNCGHLLQRNLDSDIPR